jgi:hypothetical protein
MARTAWATGPDGIDALPSIPDRRASVQERIPAPVGAAADFHLKPAARSLTRRTACPPAGRRVPDAGAPAVDC